MLIRFFLFIPAEICWRFRKWKKAALMAKKNGDSES